MYIGDFNRQLDYLYKLIKIINVQNLTQACTHVVFPVYIICRYKFTCVITQVVSCCLYREFLIRNSQFVHIHTNFLMFPLGECKLSQHDSGVPDVCESEERPAPLPPGSPWREGGHDGSQRVRQPPSELQVRRAFKFVAASFCRLLIFFYGSWRCNLVDLHLCVMNKDCFIIHLGC